MKNNKKTIVLAVVVLLLVLGMTIGASYAYFATATKTTGNDKDLNIVTENLGDIKWEGTKVYTSGDLLPGEMGIQTFTIEKNSTTGKGIYEIDLKGILDSAFGSDVEISLYKSTNPTTDNVAITEGTSAADAGDNDEVHYYKEDALTINGAPEKVYGAKTLKNKDQIILEQSEFDNSTLEKTTYYLVYHYKNAEHSQDEQQGKSFSGEISVKLILEKSKPLLSEYVAETTTDVAVDDFGNTRYIGSNPNNYINVDGDIWRIIGVMKDIDDGNGNKEDRVKIIRSNEIGYYSWDTSDSSVNSGSGINEWSQADLMKLLNPGYESETVGGSLYWNNQSGTCYKGKNNTTTSCDFTKIGIKDKLKTLIGDTVWNTGASTAARKTATDFYASERSENIGKRCTSGDYCNDTVERTTSWIGKIGLMYPSDYGYATSGGSTTDRTTCLNTDFYNYSNDCWNNNWLYLDDTYQWTLTPSLGYTTDSSATSVFFLYMSHHVDIYSVDYTYASVNPVAYLLPSVKIASGTGSQNDPFILTNN